MNREEFLALMDGKYAAIRALNETKGHDYAGDEDALSNFKVMAQTLDVSPEAIWAVYAAKHWSAVMTFCKEGDVKSEPIEGRLLDIILYCFLLLGLNEEGKEAVHPNPQEVPLP